MSFFLSSRHILETVSDSHNKYSSFKEKASADEIPLLQPLPKLLPAPNLDKLVLQKLLLRINQVPMKITMMQIITIVADF